MKSHSLTSFVLPCRNEVLSLRSCIWAIRQLDVHCEIVVVDNGSCDGSAEEAVSLGVRLLHEPRLGYGNACRAGLDAATGDILVLADADATYDFAVVPELIQLITNQNYDFVSGSRFTRWEDSDAMKPIHRYLGNPMLTKLCNFAFGAQYTDVYCGLRAFSRVTYQKIRSESPGMEFNLELAINAAKNNLRVAEIPITLRPRMGKSKLRTFRDGTRSVMTILRKLEFSPSPQA